MDSNTYLPLDELFSYEKIDHEISKDCLWVRFIECELINLGLEGTQVDEIRLNENGIIRFWIDDSWINGQWRIRIGDHVSESFFGDKGLCDSITDHPFPSQDGVQLLKCISSNKFENVPIGTLIPHMDLNFKTCTIKWGSHVINFQFEINVELRTVESE